MLYIVHSPTSDEQIVCTSHEHADRVARNRSRALGYAWRIMPITVPSEVSA